MVKGKTLLGLSIVGQTDGARVGVVKDLIFDHDTNEVLALMLQEKDLFGLIDAVIVPWQRVIKAGPDVVLVQDAQVKINLKDDSRIRGIATRETVLSGTQIVSADGQPLGTLADMFIDEATGRVEGYEISGGFISDTLRGKKFLPAPPTLEVGRDAAGKQTAVAPPAAEAQIKRS